MKKSNYTLIEIMISMAIFIMMMGILMSTFSVAADVTSSESTKINILKDANLFYSYLTKDLQGTTTDNIEAPSAVVSNVEQIDRDPDNPTPVLNDFGLKVVLRADSNSIINSIEFYSSVYPYSQDMKDALAYSPDFQLLLRYHYDSTKKKVYRDQYIINTNNDDFATDQSEATISATAYASASQSDDTTQWQYTNGVNDVNSSATILEGVSEFDITFWEDYQGGAEIIPVSSGGTIYTLPKNPTSITFSVTMANPNPYASTGVLNRGKRTVSKTIYLNK